MFRAFDCSAFIPSPPRTFSDSVGFTPVLASLGTVYQRLGPLSRIREREYERFAHHRTELHGAQDLAASQSSGSNYSIGRRFAHYSCRSTQLSRSSGEWEHCLTDRLRIALFGLIL